MSFIDYKQLMSHLLSSSAACLCASLMSVIRLILQFLQENNLHSSLRALQEESQIGLSSVDDVDKLAHNIVHGSQPILPHSNSRRSNDPSSVPC